MRYPPRGDPIDQQRREARRLTALIPFTWTTRRGVVPVFMPLPIGARLGPDDPMLEEVRRR